jgi:hypothetical protein
MTLRFFRQLLGLEDYLKEKKFISGVNSTQGDSLFVEKWEV